MSVKTSRMFVSKSWALGCFMIKERSGFVMRNVNHYKKSFLARLQHKNHYFKLTPLVAGKTGKKRIKKPRENGADAT